MPASARGARRTMPSHAPLLLTVMKEWKSKWPRSTTKVTLRECEKPTVPRHRGLP